MKANAKVRRLLFLVAVTTAASGTAWAQKKAPKTTGGKRPLNVLFIMSDDLRAELSVYGSRIAKTPNLDSLAGQSVRFERGYCQYPLCGPSRASLLTGRRPTTSGLYGNREWFGATFPDWVSLPKYFRQHNYVTLRTGKIFHGGIDDTEAWDKGGEERRWSNPIDTAAPSSVSPEDYWASFSQSIPKVTPGTQGFLIPTGGRP